MADIDTVGGLGVGLVVHTLHFTPTADIGSTDVFVEELHAALAADLPNQRARREAIAVSEGHLVNGIVVLRVGSGVLLSERERQRGGLLQAKGGSVRIERTLADGVDGSVEVSLRDSGSAVGSGELSLGFDVVQHGLGVADDRSAVLIAGTTILRRDGGAAVVGIVIVIFRALAVDELPAEEVTACRGVRLVIEGGFEARVAGLVHILDFPALGIGDVGDGVHLAVVADPALEVVEVGVTALGVLRHAVGADAVADDGSAVAAVEDGLVTDLRGSAEEVLHARVELVDTEIHDGLGQILG